MNAKGMKKSSFHQEEPPLGLMVTFLTILPPYKKGDCRRRRREREREAEKCYFSRSRYRRRRRRRCENH